jgi:hypothetical protein
MLAAAAARRCPRPPAAASGRVPGGADSPPARPDSAMAWPQAEPTSRPGNLSLTRTVARVGLGVSAGTRTLTVTDSDSYQPRRPGT